MDAVFFSEVGLFSAVNGVFACSCPYKSFMVFSFLFISFSKEKVDVTFQSFPPRIRCRRKHGRTNCPPNFVTFTRKVMVIFNKTISNKTLVMFLFYALHLVVCSFHLLLTSCTNMLILLGGIDRIFFPNY